MPSTTIGGSGSTTIGGSGSVAIVSPAPVLSSATISGSDGLTLTLVFTELTGAGAGGFYGWTLTPSGGAAGLSYSSGYGTSTWVFLTQRPIASGETATLDFTQPGNGIEASSGGADLASFSGFAVTNNSTYSALLLFDQFTTADAAPLNTPRTAEPGPGQWLALEISTGAAMSIVSGELTMARPTGAQAYASYGLVASAAGVAVPFTRAPGLALYGKVNVTVAFTIAPPFWQLSGVLGGPSVMALSLSDATQLFAYDSATSILVGSSLSGAQYYSNAIIQRANGMWILIKGGTQYPNWTLVWVGTVERAIAYYAQYANFNAGCKADDFTIKQLLASVFTDDYGIATGFSPFVADGDTHAVDADCLQYFCWHPITSEVREIQVRRTDDDNCWILRCTQGGNLSLIEKVAGVETPRDTGKTQTWTVGTTYRIGIFCFGANIRTYVDKVAKHNYASAAFQQTATGTKIPSAAGISNWERWPATFSGSALDDLAPSGATVSLAVNPNRIVWVTDTHCGQTAVTGSPLKEDEAPALAAYINALRPLFLVDTGDKGDGFGPDTDNYRDTFYRKIRCPQWSIVGNHDEDEDSTVAVANTWTEHDSIFPLAAFPRHWTAVWPAAKIWIIGIHCRINHAPEPGGWAIDAGERTYLSDQLAAMPGDHKAIIAMHPPLDNAVFGNGILDAYGGTELKAIISANSSKIPLLIFGHRHSEPATNTSSGVLQMRGASAAYHAGGVGPAANGFMVMDYDSGANTITVHCRYARQPYARYRRDVWTPLVISL